MLWIELIIFLAIIVIGARIGGIGMGTVAGLGLIVFVFIFKMPQGSPPVIVLGMILAINFDQTGTTHIGKYLLNHSFMRPGLVTTISAVLIALLITYIF